MRGSERVIRTEESQALAALLLWFVVTAAWWALALWPVEAGPAWLERTRFACFGISESGLPDGGGWIGLIGGPIGMLGIIVVGWQSGIRSVLHSARSSRRVAGLLSALALGCVVMITGAALRVQEARAQTTFADTDTAVPPDNYPRLDRAAPPLRLTAQDGRLLDLAALVGRPVLVTFAYAHCVTVCPLVVMDVLRAQDALRNSGDSVAVVIVTLDPWRDPPSRLPAMAKSWGITDPAAWVLSASVAEVESTLDVWEVPRSRNATTGEITHPSLVYVVDRDGRLAYASTGGIEALVSLVRRL